jgi:hypothetical protein
MIVSSRRSSFLIFVLTGALLAAACGAASPTAPTPAPSPVPTVAAAAALGSISLSASTVIGGGSVTGTATLTAAAPTSGALVLLSATDPLTVAASVTVPSGATAATFSISTRTVGGTTPATVTGSYGGASQSAGLSVTRTSVATASFGVSGPTESDTCTLTNGGNTLDCTFNGSTSTAPGTVTAWDWSYSVAATFAQSTSGPVLTNPTVNCSLVTGAQMAAGTSWFAMTVRLTIHDSDGNVSAEAISRDVRLIPVGVCGY